MWPHVPQPYVVVRSVLSSATENTRTLALLRTVDTPMLL